MSSDVEETFVVERIVQHRKRGGKYEFLVKWRGWPNTENSWIQKEDFVHEKWVREYMRKLDIKELFKKKHPSALVRVLAGLQSLSNLKCYSKGISRNALVAIISNYFPGTEKDAIKFGVKEGIEKKLVVCVQNAKYLLTEKGKMFDIIGASSTTEENFKTPVKLRLPKKKQSLKKKRKMKLRQTNWNRKHKCDQCGKIQVGEILEESGHHPGLLLCEICVAGEVSAESDSYVSPQEEVRISSSPEQPMSSKLKLKISMRKKRKREDDGDWAPPPVKRQRKESEQYYGLYRIIPGDFNWKCKIRVEGQPSITIDHRDEEECARLTRAFIKNHEQTPNRYFIYGQRKFLSRIKYVGPIERVEIRGEPMRYWDIPEDAILVAKTLYYSTHGWPKIYAQAVESMLKLLTRPNIYALPMRTLIFTYGRGEDLWEEIQNTLAEVALGRGRFVRDRILHVPIRYQEHERQAFVAMLIQKIQQYGSLFAALDGMGLIADTNEKRFSELDVYTPLGLQRYPIVRSWVDECKKSESDSIRSESPPVKKREEFVYTHSTSSETHFPSSEQDDSQSMSRSRSVSFDRSNSSDYEENEEEIERDSPEIIDADHHFQGESSEDEDSSDSKEHAVASPDVLSGDARESDVVMQKKVGDKSKQDEMEDEKLKNEGMPAGNDGSVAIKDDEGVKSKKDEIEEKQGALDPNKDIISPKTKAANSKIDAPLIVISDVEGGSILPNSDSESSDGELASKIAAILEQVRLKREPRKNDVNMKEKPDFQAKTDDSEQLDKAIPETSQKKRSLE